MKYEAVIGLEIHSELKTNTKIFCSCATSFGADQNTHVCPVCLGLPGVLPVVNKRVVEFAIKAGLALNCTINKFSKFDRKNYYYPDLPKNFQTSQFDLPIAEHGYVDIEVEGKTNVFASLVFIWKKMLVNSFTPVLQLKILVALMLTIIVLVYHLSKSYLNQICILQQKLVHIWKK